MCVYIHICIYLYMHIIEWRGVRTSNHARWSPYSGCSCWNTIGILTKRSCPTKVYI